MDSIIVHCPYCDIKIRAAVARLQAGHRPVCPSCRKEREREKALAALSLETRSMKFCCAHDDLPFWVTFGRERVNGRFRIRTVTREALGSAGQVRVSARREVPLEWETMDFAGFYCPYCDSAGRPPTEGFNRCGGCNGFFCTAGTIVLPNGTRTWACPCGHSAPVAQGPMPPASCFAATVALSADGEGTAIVPAKGGPLRK